MPGSAVALDTNLAVLLAVGLADKAYIAKHKRLKKYDLKSFETLDEILGAADGIIWCPHVLAETSNMVRYLSDPIRGDATKALSLLIARYPENPTPSVRGAARPEYGRLGLTDAILLTLTAAGATLLTDDLDLHIAALGAGLSSINFNELRDDQA